MRTPRKAVRDSNVSRNYMALKLAMWITGGSYWQGGLTERQVLWLVERAINHPEVVARWETRDVEIDMPKRGSYAWAIRGAKDRLLLPEPSWSPLLVLHEVAHLLPATKRESAHGPGFVATHLMLIELLKPKMLDPMVAAYHATSTPYDVSRIPPGKSSYAPLSSTFGYAAARNWLSSAITSGQLGRKEAEVVGRAVRAMGPPPATAPLPPPTLPLSVSIPTETLLACNSDSDIAKAVLGQLRLSFEPRELKRPKRLNR